MIGAVSWDKPAILVRSALESVTDGPCYQFWLHQPIAATMTHVILG